MLQRASGAEAESLRDDQARQCLANGKKKKRMVRRINGDWVCYKAHCIAGTRTGRLELAAEGI